MRCCRPVDVKIGVLALQGNVSEHIDAFVLALERLGCGRSSDVITVHHPADLEGCHALALPGRGINHHFPAHRQESSL